MATRIRVRKGDTEVEYEGSEQFLKTELASLLQAASTFPAGSGAPARPVAASTASPGKPPARKTSSKRTSATRTSSTETAESKSSAMKTSSAKASAPAAPTSPEPDGKAAAGSDSKAPPASPTADIAGKIGCKHGTDLVLAASAQLNIGAGQRSFSRAALLGEMKTATEYYQPVYGKNLSRYLRNLIKERQLAEPRPGAYALTAPARREIRRILAD